MLTDLDKVILETLLGAQAPVASKELAQKCGVAINTVRKEIAIINREVAPHGIQIRSKTSQGHTVEITDPKAAQHYVGNLLYHLKRSRLAGMTWSSRVYYLARRILSCEHGVSTEVLCQELFCSQGALNRDLRQVKECLAEYGITLTNRRGGYGLRAEGNEWNIRQCLIYQHKVYQIGEDMAGPREGDFRAQFRMEYGADYEQTAREVLVELLRSQRDFTLPLTHFPKVIHSVRLSQTRSKYRENISFTPEQVARAKETAEYVFAQALHQRLIPPSGEAPREEDVLCTAMLLLSYESQNRRLTERPDSVGRWEELAALKKRLERFCDPALFDETFDRDFLCFLYTLENRRVFGVIADPEPNGNIRRAGLRSADLCLEFARFYTGRHGIRPNREDTLRAFYLFNRLLKQEDNPCFYTKNMLVISRYGIDCARTMAQAVRLSCGKAAGRVTPCEYLEHLEDAGDYDLIVTDSAEARLQVYGLPVLGMDYAPGQDSIPALEEYFRDVARKEEVEMVKDSFHAIRASTKEEVLARTADLLADIGFDRESVLDHLMENDALIDLVRGEGLVLLPVLMEDLPQDVFLILCPPEGVKWDGEPVHAFVCYTRSGQPHREAILRRVLMELMKMMPANLRKLAKGKADTLYGNE